MINHLTNFLTPRSNAYKVIIAVLLNSIVLSPMLNSGYISDDALNSLTRGVMLENNQTLFGMTFAIFKHWLFGEGRFFPLAFYSYSLFFKLDNLYLYKASIVGLIVINLLMFGYLVKLITKSPALAFLAIILPALFFQFRLYHDPILSFHWLQQLVVLYIFASLILLVFYLDKSSKAFLILSLLAYLLSLLTYETTYLFSLLHFIVIYFRLTKKSILEAFKVSLPFFCLSIILVLISIALKHYVGAPLSGGAGGGAYVPNLDVVAFSTTLIKQTYAAFPLSYYFIDPQKIFEHGFDYLRNYFSINIVFIGFGYFILIMEISKQLLTKLTDSKNNYNFQQLLSLGVLLLILPGVSISLSPKYQKEIIWGIGYLPVYISYFGLVMIVVSLIHLMYKKLNFTNQNAAFVLSIAIAATLGYTGVVNYNNNRIVTEHANAIFLYPRTIIEDAISAGLFQKVPDDAYLLVNSANLWDQPAFYRMHSGVKFKYAGSEAKYLQEARSENLFYLSYDSHAKENGYAILGKIKILPAANAKNYAVASGKAYIYVRTAYFPPANQNFSVHGIWVNQKQLAQADTFALAEGQLELIASGVNWKLYVLSAEDKLIDLQSLKVNAI